MIMIDHEHSGFRYQTEDFKNHDTLLVTDSIGSIFFVDVYQLLTFIFIGYAVICPPRMDTTSLLVVLTHQLLV